MSDDNPYRPPLAATHLLPAGDVVGKARPTAVVRVGAGALFTGILFSGAGVYIYAEAVSRLPAGPEKDLNLGILVACCFNALVLSVMLAYWKQRTKLRFAPLVFDGAAATAITTLAIAAFPWLI